MATGAGVGPYTDVYGVTVDYASFPRKREEVRQVLLNDPNRFQAISQREDRSDVPIDAALASANGRYFIQHRGCMVMKSGNDQAILKELLVHVKPATVIELGTFTGGNAVWIADMMKMEDVTCSVYSMDINNPAMIEDRVKDIKPENVTFLQGDSNKIADTFTADFLKSLPHPWVVVEDSHVNVSGILEHFIGYMEVGDYFVVEDSNPFIPVQPGYGRISKEEYTPCGNNLLKILKEFLTKHKKDFAVDSYFTDFYGYNGTWHWHGFIRRM